MEKQFKNYLNNRKQDIDTFLKGVLPNPKGRSSVLHKAMYYSVFPGGKRFRPLLTIAASESCGGNIHSAISVAAGIEIIHCYSLVHDDLPAMDNSKFRRGRLSCFAKFGEDVAILAGDALLTLGFRCVAMNKKYGAELVREISRFCGHQGMVEGQTVDMQVQKGMLSLDIPTLEYINTLKTGALITASAMCGAIVSGAGNKKTNCLRNFGIHLGYMFQIVDDIIDKQGYVQVVGLSNAYKKVEKESECATKSIKNKGLKEDILLEFIQWLTDGLKQ